MLNRSESASQPKHDLKASSHERSHKTRIYAESTPTNAIKSKKKCDTKVKSQDSEKPEIKEKCLDDYFQFKQKMIQLR